MPLLKQSELAPARERAVQPHRVRGVLYTVFGVLGMIVSPLIGLVAAMALTPIGGAFVWVLCSAGAGWLLKQGRRHRARGAVEVLNTDPRPPVLYLRSFAADDRTAEAVGQAISIRGVEFTSVSTEEEQIAKVAGKIGPLVAIGRPSDKVAHLGAHPMYLRDDQWQAKVQELMNRSSLVIMRAGLTEGFWWEVAQAVTRLNPQKVLWLMPFTGANYAAFAQRANTILPRPLPPPPDKWSYSVGSLKGWVWFERDWTPHLEQPVWTDTFLCSGMPVAGLLQRILAPFYRMNGHVGASLRGSSGARLVAIAIDLVLALVVLMLAGLSNNEALMWAVAGLIALYFVVLDLPQMGGTVGKRLMKVRVLDAEGDEPSPAHSVLRGLAKCCMVVALPVSFLVALVVLKHSAWRRMPHDLLTRTWVVDGEEPDPLMARASGLTG